MFADLVPLYPLYALMFADSGQSDAEISGLLLIWSLTGIVAEVPTGAIADRFSRRGALAFGGVLQAIGYAGWLLLPGFTGYAIGFVLWGIGGALASGSMEALVYDGLAALGATAQYPRLLGRITAAGLIAQIPAAVAATVLYALGGYPLLGWVSVACCLTAAGLAVMLRDVRPADRLRDGSETTPGAILGDDLGYLATLKAGIAEAVSAPAVRRLVVAAGLLEGLDALEEYFTLLAQDWGVPTRWVPLAELVIPLAGAAATWWSSRRMTGANVAGRRMLATALGGGAVLLAGAQRWAAPAGLAGVAVFYGLYRIVLVAVGSRLQEAIGGAARATVTSVAALLSELAAIAIFGLWALGGLAPIAALILLLAALLPWALRHRPIRG